MAGWRDWTKARKIAMLRKHRRLPHNYRALLLPGNRRGLVTQNAAFRMACPRFVQGQSMCPAAYTVKEWLKGIALEAGGALVVDADAVAEAAAAAGLFVYGLPEEPVG